MGVQTTASAVCDDTGPYAFGEIIYGGGVHVLSALPGVTVNSSYPSPGGGGWSVEINNTSGSPAKFKVYADCGPAETGTYGVVETTTDAPAGQQTFGTALCPVGESVVGGGGQSSSSATSVNLGSEWPYEVPGTGPYPGHGAYRVSVNNASAADSTLITYAICTNLESSFSENPSVPSAPSSVTQIQLSCGGWVTDAGAWDGSLSSSLGPDMSSSWPIYTPAAPFLGVPTDQWGVSVDNTTSTAQNIQSVLVCV
jgi:hypothetical protein